MTRVVTEILTHRYTGIRSKELESCRFRSRSGNDNSVFKRTVFFKTTDNLCYRRFFLTNRNVNTDYTVPFLVDDRIQSNGSFTGLTVTDDKFTLTTSDRNKSVNRFNTGCHRFMNRLTSHNPWSFLFNKTDFCCFDWSFSINWLTKSVYNTPKKCITDRNT